MMCIRSRETTVVSESVIRIQTSYHLMFKIIKHNMINCDDKEWDIIEMYQLDAPVALMMC